MRTETSARRRLTTGAVLALLAFVLYAPAFWWGAPHATAPDRAQAWGVDDEAPLGALGQVYSTLTRQRNEGQNLGYPLLSYFVIVGAQSPYLLYLKATGKLGAASPDYPFGLRDPVRALAVLTWIAHAVSVLYAVGVVVAAYVGAKDLWGERAARVTALIVLVSYPSFYYARTSNPDMAVLFFTAAALAVYARCLTRGITSTRAAWLGVFVGAALATKEPSFASFVALPFVLVLLHARQRKEQGERPGEAWKIPAICAAAAILTFGMGSGAFLDPGRYVAHLEFVRQRSAEIAASGVSFQQGYPRTVAGSANLMGDIARRLADAMTVPGLLAAAAGLVYAALRERRALLFALPAATYLAILIGARSSQLRYVMPAAFTLAFFAARLFDMLMEREDIWRRLATAGAALVIGLGLLRGLDLTAAMLQDSRYAAARWVVANLQSGDRIDYFGPAQKLPPLPAAVSSEQALPYLGGPARQALGEPEAEQVRRRWRENPPAAVLVIPDYRASTLPYGGAMPPAIYDELNNGSLGFALDTLVQSRPLFPWVRRPALDYPTVNPPIRIYRSRVTAP
ncbi:MAG TPA: glycosyltransferase family 39 protein [Gemmatimonadaceae bacterium]|nr:glycosyltransferase family 39 protein [Gemmatimonadaceae bacterium]